MILQRFLLFLSWLNHLLNFPINPLHTITHKLPAVLLRQWAPSDRLGRVYHSPPPRALRGGRQKLGDRGPGCRRATRALRDDGEAGLAGRTRHRRSYRVRRLRRRLRFRRYCRWLCRCGSLRRAWRALTDSVHAPSALTWIRRWRGNGCRRIRYWCRRRRRCRIRNRLRRRYESCSCTARTRSPRCIVDD